MNNVKIIILAIVGLILLSGCIDKSKDTINLASNTSSNSTTGQPIITPLPITTIRESISSEEVKNITNKSTLSVNSSKNAFITPGEDWCKTGLKMNLDEITFTIQGKINDNGKTLCYAKWTNINNQSTTTTNYYFSQDGTVQKMNSTSTSNEGNSAVSSTISTTIGENGKSTYNYNIK